MIPPHRESHSTFRFADDRIVPRLHPEGVAAGRRIAVFRLGPATGGRREPPASATAGKGGWVELAEPLLVRAGGGFVAAAGDAPPGPGGRG